MHVVSARGDEEGQLANISFILRNEVVRFDPDRIGVLETELGLEATEDLLYESTERLVDRLVDLRRAVDLGHEIEVKNLADAIEGISAKVGLVTVSRIARDVIKCAESGDFPAFHATTARLIRIGEGCVTGAFEFSDQFV